MWILFVLGCPGAKDPDSDSPTESTETTTADACSLESCNVCNEECSPRGCNGSGAYMLPGANCLNCHSVGTGAGALPLAAAGTVFSDATGSSGADAVTVRLVDAAGKTWETTTVDVGNFLFEETITWPATAELENAKGKLQMKDKVESGACNSCHSCGGANGQKLYAP